MRHAESAKIDRVVSVLHSGSDFFYFFRAIISTFIVLRNRTELSTAVRWKNVLKIFESLKNRVFHSRRFSLNRERSSFARDNAFFLDISNFTWHITFYLIFSVLEHQLVIFFLSSKLIRDFCYFCGRPMNFPKLICTIAHLSKNSLFLPYFLIITHSHFYFHTSPIRNYIVQFPQSMKSLLSIFLFSRCLQSYKHKTHIIEFLLNFEPQRKWEKSGQKNSTKNRTIAIGRMIIFQIYPKLISMIFFRFWLHTALKMSSPFEINWKSVFFELFHFRKFYFW